MKYDCRSLIENEGYMDYLTGLFNRRGLNELFACLSAEEIIHCIYIDVDTFKKLMALEVADAKAHVIFPLIQQRIDICSAWMNGLADDKIKEIEIDE